MVQASGKLLEALIRWACMQLPCLPPAPASSSRPASTPCESPFEQGASRYHQRADTCYRLTTQSTLALTSDSARRKTRVPHVRIRSCRAGGSLVRVWTADAVSPGFRLRHFIYRLRCLQRASPGSQVALSTFALQSHPDQQSPLNTPALLAAALI